MSVLVLVCNTCGAHLILDLFSSVVFVQSSIIGVATRYELDGPGMESRQGGGRDFPQTSRPALGPTQPPIQRVPGLFTGVKRPGRGVDRGVALTTHHYLALRLKKE